MKVALGEEGLHETFQAPFEIAIPCVHCKEVAHIAFVAHEGSNAPDDGPYVCKLHENEPSNYWPHDCCCFAVYICRTCCEATVVYNQG